MIGSWLGPELGEGGQRSSWVWSNEEVGSWGPAGFCQDHCSFCRAPGRAIADAHEGRILPQGLSKVCYLLEVI